MSLLVVLLLAFFSTFTFTALFLFCLKSGPLLDIPISRSSHSVPTPKGGGLIFVLVISGIVQFYLPLDSATYSTQLFYVFVLGLLIAASGLLDDLFNLPIVVRLLIHIALVGCLLLICTIVPPINILGYELDNTYLLIALTGLALVWLINLFNFMDGIDGLACTEAFFVFLASAFLIWLESYNHIVLVLLIAASAICGFMPFNISRARLFMGDTGSIFLGFIIGAIGLISIQYTHMNIWTWSILLGVFVVDSSMTLLIRMFNQQSWFKAHRSHAYQHSAIQLKSHSKVVFFVAIINLLWLLPLAWYSLNIEKWGFLLTLIAYAPLVLFARYFNAGKKTY